MWVLGTLSVWVDIPQIPTVQADLLFARLLASYRRATHEVFFNEFPYRGIVVLEDNQFVQAEKDIRISIFFYQPFRSTDSDVKGLLPRLAQCPNHCA